jgi:trk system potassium uptake protein
VAAVETLSYAVRPKVVAAYLGQLIFIVGLASIPPLIFAVLVGEWAHVLGHAVVVIGSLGGGWLMYRGRTSADIQANEALVAVVAIFLITPLIFSIPMMTAGIDVLDAFFEATSGITTTGLSTFAGGFGMPRSLLFSAAWLQWLGGMGIMVLSFALLFGQGAGARRLTGALGEQQAVLSGTRAYATATIRIYIALTLIGMAALGLAGANWFAAITLMLSAISTGSFSPFASSLGGVSHAVQVIVILFCFIGAVAVPVIYNAMRSRWNSLLRDVEVRALAAACIVVCALLLGRWLADQRTGTFGAFDLVMTAISAQTTAGFSFAPIAALDSFSKLALIAAMAIGGGIGSTAGGVKLLRLVVFVRIVQLMILKTRLSPRAVVSNRISGREWSDDDLVRVLIVMLLFVGVDIVSWLPFLWSGYDPLNSLFEVVSATATAGLSTGITSAALPAGLKILLCLDMLLGRLEVLPILVFLAPRTWAGKRRRSIAGGKTAKP